MKATVLASSGKDKKSVAVRLVIDPANPENLISRRAAAVMLGICPRTVYRHERSGQLKPYRRHARATSYRLGDVLALRNEWAATPQAAPPPAAVVTTAAAPKKASKPARR